ncbi:hypothetical protein BALCAV_0213390 [Alkalihalobacillus alcalophilus ATCC 27647 = CGMCC 1.3604]|uniref:Uncharacterized protein n=1 Tax=Alkalihalobacillus alcalophilus ATCC 27647 = CGMCC 1.3604 TaxID=1218173 RepID=A0A094WGK7_ALKAL|nr:hypothetical protein [Alkalihalobacillus alcalophilus]KGA96884.1 hypothetical protein BALCAV_0213390 [Alkalihalobacillus alcalophilus ATCC 27647 = CGMCC 1.3604]MED1564306.1 hypothetical protein [Alkalihalobacillus alcalophilus]
MNLLNAEEAVQFFNSYGLKVDEKSVKEWIKDMEMKAPANKNRPMIEEDLHCYNHWCFVRGTAYEEGIDDTTKIERLVEENFLLKKEIEKLKKEQDLLEEALGMPDKLF